MRKNPKIKAQNPNIANQTKQTLICLYLGAQFELWFLNFELFYCSSRLVLMYQSFTLAKRLAGIIIFEVRLFLIFFVCG